MMFKVVMKFAEKCPRCGGNVQTKSIRKAIGLGFVNIPVAQFCLGPTCDWYQDFSESRNPEDIQENVIQIKIPGILQFFSSLARCFMRRNRRDLKKGPGNIR
jgi:hypothetical protein